MVEDQSKAVDDHIANMEGEIALPRSNGELLFAAPWEARAFGLAVALNEAGLYPWGDFSRGLAHEIAGEEANGSPSTYYERWLATLENHHRQRPRHPRRDRGDDGRTGALGRP